LAGKFASALFAFGILNAGLFTAAVLPLSTSYLVCEAFGFEAALDRGFREAPVFFSLFAAGLVIGAVLVLLPGVPLLQLSIASQLVQGLLLPLELVLPHRQRHHLVDGRHRRRDRAVLHVHAGRRGLHARGIDSVLAFRPVALVYNGFAERLEAELGRCSARPGGSVSAH
jgi:hypothetical protein